MTRRRIQVDLLKHLQVSNTTHGCVDCRSREFREAMVNEVISLLGFSSFEFACPVCSARWLVRFDAPDGNLQVTFSAPSLSSVAS